MVCCMSEVKPVVRSGRGGGLGQKVSVDSGVAKEQAYGRGRCGHSPSCGRETGAVK